MSIFNNEYLPLLNRKDTNLYVGNFTYNLINHLISKFNLLFCIPPVFSHSNNSFVLKNNIRTIDFDNASNSQIFQVIDSVDKWMYFYLRDSQIPLNNGIICLSNYVNRDANLDKNELIQTPMLSFAISIPRIDYTSEYVEKQAKLIIKYLNEVIAYTKVNNFVSKHSILDYDTITATKLIERFSKLPVSDILINNTQNKPLFITELGESIKFKQSLPSFENNLIDNKMYGSFFVYSSIMNKVIDFFSIGMQLTYEQLLTNKINFGSYYDSKLKISKNNSEWNYIVNINLANLLLWLLDKTHYSEIYTGAWSESLFEDAESDKVDIL